MSEKEQLIQTWDREHKITLKVLNAYPQDKQEYRPHEKSRSAQELVWQFVAEQGVLSNAIDTGKIDFEHMPPPPATYKEALQHFQTSYQDFKTKLEKLPEAELNKMVKFPTGPNQMTDMPIRDLCWTMVMDRVHHRGQFSVYLRLAGGKVPSIYGPSADEPWM